MNQAVKAYFFIPSGMKNYIERGFDGWRFVFFIYTAFAAILAIQTAGTFKTGILIFLQPMFLLLLLSIISVAGAFAMGAKEPLVKGMRLVALCLPPAGLTLFFLAEKSPMVYFVVYPVALYVFGSIFMGPKGRLINGAMGLSMAALTLVFLYLIAITTAGWFDRKVVIDGYKISIEEIPAFSGDQLNVYRFILLSSPEIGHIPQAGEISDSLKIRKEAVEKALVELDGKGRLVLAADGEIRYAFPWAAYDHGISLSVRKTPSDPVLGPIYAASAIHALSAATIFKGGFVRIVAPVRDTAEPLVLEITNGKVSGCSCPGALVYMSDLFSEVEFYSTTAGAKAKYRGRFDATRLLDIERAIQVAGEMLEKRTAGVL